MLTRLVYNRIKCRVVVNTATNRGVPHKAELISYQLSDYELLRRILLQELGI